jgi:beta-1,4-mannooligosaccharide/beta-1,4-mannosyl-N-acetylglucosamine phosphorylase
MKKVLINGYSLPNIPFEERKEKGESPLWRYSKNPITKRNPVPGVGRIFNSAVVPFNGKFIGVFRGERVNGVTVLYLGHSDDGIKWNFDQEPLKFVDEEGKPVESYYYYDPRLVKVEDTYYVICCLDFYGASIGLMKTKDFKTFVRMENPFIPFNRNAVLFPRKVNGNYLLLSRPSDSSHTPFGDIFLSESPDLVYYGHHRHVMSPSKEWWESLKIGAGPAPIETKDGWLLFYHGVTRTCNGYVYSMSAAILDIDHPSKVLYRCKNFLLTPERPYEEAGFVSNVVFPCATMQDQDTNRLVLYYGAADSYVGMAFGYVDEILDYIKNNSRLDPSDSDLGR